MTKKTVYEQFDKTFPDMKAAVVIHNGEAVAKIATKGHVVYLHWFYKRMVRHVTSGSGYNYEKEGIRKAAETLDYRNKKEGCDVSNAEQAFLDALMKEDGNDWEVQLRKAGFIAVRAI